MSYPSKGATIVNVNQAARSTIIKRLDNILRMEEWRLGFEKLFIIEITYLLLKCFAERLPPRARVLHSAVPVRNAKYYRHPH